MGVHPCESRRPRGPLTLSVFHVLRHPCSGPELPATRAGIQVTWRCGFCGRLHDSCTPSSGILHGFTPKAAEPCSEGVRRATGNGHSDTAPATAGAFFLLELMLQF